MNLDWNGAACRTADPGLFFGPDSESAGRRDWRESRARAVCARCPFQVACLEYALAEGIEHGVWGGMTEAGRANLRHWRRKKASRDRARQRAAA